jgi:hypothetical protein
VAKGDAIMARKDGVWYTVEKVETGTKLTLTQPFQGGDMESEFLAARVKVENWDHEKLDFRIVADVPAVPAQQTAGTD